MEHHHLWVARKMACWCSLGAQSLVGTGAFFFLFRVPSQQHTFSLGKRSGSIKAVALENQRIVKRQDVFFWSCESDAGSRKQEVGMEDIQRPESFGRPLQLEAVEGKGELERGGGW